MNILVLSIGVLLMAMSAVHCRDIRSTLSQFKQWWLSTDYMNSIAAIMALMMLLLVNWGWY